jgi:drug/metabolite transporter (DMT)-like permease
MEDTQPVSKIKTGELLRKPLYNSPRFAASARTYGIFAALASAVFFGMTPIFGKQAIINGVHPVTVVAIRTLLASILMFVLMVVFYRKFLYIYPAGLIGCLLAGAVNGVGSLFYYNALGRIEAGVGQLLYSLYPFFLVIWLSLDRQVPGKLTIFRLSLAITAVYLLTRTQNQPVDIIGVIMMLLASALYALHIPINQKVLYEMPAPTVTAYTLLAMSLVVTPVYFVSSQAAPPEGMNAWLPILGLTFVTFLSRLTLFMGVKHIGSMQTALLGLSEILVTLFFAYIWLGERLNYLQWVGAVLMITSLMLVVFEKPSSIKPTSQGWLSWIRPPTRSSDIPWQPHD